MMLIGGEFIENCGFDSYVYFMMEFVGGSCDELEDENIFDDFSFVENFYLNDIEGLRYVFDVVFL